MKKKDARELFEELMKESVSTGAWTVHRPEHVQNDRRVRYAVVMTKDGNRSGDIPTVPLELSEFLRKRDFSSRDIRKQLIDPNEDPIDDSLWGPSDRVLSSSDPYYAVVIDNGEYDEIPRTAEEERKRRLSSEISSAIGIPGNTSAADKLAEEFETIGDVLGASENELRSVNGVGEKTAQAIIERRSPELQKRLDEFDGDILIVTENDSETFEPLYIPDSKTSINRELLDNL